MGKSFIIATGINQYQVLQPLSYAEHDAQAVWDFGVYQANLSEKQCVLLTDSSGLHEGRSTYPNRATIEGWIDQICGEGTLGGLPITAADQLWWFFSGYGVSYETHDYLMPREGDPASVEGTGISMRSLFTRLKQIPTSNILVMLDINRATSTQSGSLLGSETSQLAREMEIPTLLSCQPGQFSQETSDLRQGLFTAALLEGLRSGQCNTLARLEEYLKRRLQELTDHHMRPSQQPLMVVAPPEKVDRVILPLDSPTTTTPSESTIGQPVISKNSNENESARPPIAEESELQEMQNEDAQFWRQLILTSAGLAIILIAGVFFRNKDLLVSTPDGDGVSESPQQIESISKPPLQVVEPPEKPASPPEESASPPEKPASPPEESASPPEKPVSPPVFKPIDSPIQPRQPAPTVVTPAATEQVNRDILGKARTAIGLNQASKYSSAIDMARQIEPGEPLYAEARQDIEFWSRAILDIAIGRSKMGKFNEAIAAAKLVPSDSDSYSEAEDAIALWTVQAQQQQTNQEILNRAKELIVAGQASSYNQAIDLARSIPEGQPNYFAAKKSIEQWSNDILAIAKERAQNNSFQSAIAAASLVPADTKTYEQAQEAIATWQESLKQE